MSADYFLKLIKENMGYKLIFSIVFVAVSYFTTLELSGVNPSVLIIGVFFVLGMGVVQFISFSDVNSLQRTWDIIQKLIVVFIIFFVSYSLYMTWGLSGRQTYSIFYDRDIYRAINLFDNVAMNGPEFTNGGKTPGGGFYIVYNLLLRIAGSVDAMFYIIFLMNIISGLVVAREAYKHSGFFSGLVAFVVMFFSPAVLDSLVTTHWNPSFAVLSSAILGVLFFRMAMHGSWHLLPFATLLSGFTAQMHFSFMVPGICLILLSGLFKFDNKFKVIVLAILGLLFPFSIFFLTEFQQGFPIIKGMLAQPALESGVGLRFQSFWHVVSKIRHIIPSNDMSATGRSHLFIPILLLFAVAIPFFSLMILVGFISLMSRMAKSSRLALVLYLVVPIAIIIFFTRSYPRHFLFIEGAVAIFIGVILAQTELYFRNLSKIYRYMAYIGVLAWAVGVSNSIYGMSRDGLKEDNQNLRNALKEIASQIPGGRMAFDEHLAVLSAKVPGDLRGSPLREPNLRIGFDYEFNPDMVMAKECYMLLYGQYVSTDISEINTILSKKIGSNFVDGSISLIHEYPVGRYYKYKTKDMNCLKGSKNRYILNPFEEVLFDQPNARMPKGSGKYQALHIGDKYKLSLLFTEIHTQGIDALRLDTTNLQGFSAAFGNENSEWGVRNLKLEITSLKDGTKHEFLVDHLGLDYLSPEQDGYGGLFTPWVFDLGRLEKGEYTVHISGIARNVLDFRTIGEFNFAETLPRPISIKAGK